MNKPTRQPAPDARQTQFLTVITRDEATARFQQHLRLAPLGKETRALSSSPRRAPRGKERGPLARALGRVLADDIRSAVDVPGFDRSNVDGFALRAEDTF